MDIRATPGESPSTARESGFWNARCGCRGVSTSRRERAIAQGGDAWHLSATLVTGPGFLANRRVVHAVAQPRD